MRAATLGFDDAHGQGDHIHLSSNRNRFELKAQCTKYAKHAQACASQGSGLVHLLQHYNHASASSIVPKATHRGKDLRSNMLRMSRRSRAEWRYVGCADVALMGSMFAPMRAMMGSACGLLAQMRLHRVDHWCLEVAGAAV